MIVDFNTHPFEEEDFFLKTKEVFDSLEIECKVLLNRQPSKSIGIESNGLYTFNSYCSLIIKVDDDLKSKVMESLDISHFGVDFISYFLRSLFRLRNASVNIQQNDDSLDFAFMNNEFNIIAALCKYKEMDNISALNIFFPVSYLVSKNWETISKMDDFNRIIESRITGVLMDAQIYG